MGDTAADIQRRREEREQRDGEKEAQKQHREEWEREEARREETTSQQMREWPKSSQELRGVTLKWTQTVEKRRAYLNRNPGIRKGHMTDIYLTGSDEEAIVDFVKDHKELYDKKNEHFKNKARKGYLWERFTSSCKLSVKVCKT